MILTMVLSGAQAATISTFGGVGLIFLLWLSFKPRNKGIRIFGKIFLIISSILVLLSVVLLFVPDSFVRQIFLKITTSTRFLNWEMAQKAFLERPLLGWGPENYTLIFTKYFNPRLFVEGGEIWFDRTHDIVFDTLATTGILGFVSYLGLFGSLFYVFWKKYFKEKTIDFWTFSIFTAIPVSYFIQNLTVFDMVASLMMFCLILGFGASFAKKKKEIESKKNLLKIHYSHIGEEILGFVLVFIFIFTFLEFIVQPARTDYLVIKALRTPQERVQLYEKTLKVSPVGKYQIR